MSIARVRSALRGISGIHVTPYDPSGEVNLGLLKSLVTDMAQAGVHNIVSAGNTGEFFTLSLEEILRVHETSVEAVGGRAVATASVGRSLRDAVALARGAKRFGFDSVMAHYPQDPFAAPHSQAEYFLELAEASELPVIAYVRSDLISASDLARVAVHPNIAGVKFASTNLMLLAECIRATRGREAEWVCGLAEGWAASFYALGARGFTSGLVNVAPQKSFAIWEALDKGDYGMASRLVDEIAVFETMRTKHNNGANVTVVKEAMTLLGRAVGPVRLPGLPRLEDADRRKLRDVLAGWRLLAGEQTSGEQASGEQA